MDVTANPKQPLLRVISVLIGGLAYSDRMRMLYALDAHVDQHVILTRDESEVAPYLHRTRIIKPRYRLPGPLFCLWAGIMAVAIVFRDHNKSPWIINEDFLWFSLIIPRLVLGRRAIVSFSLFAQSRSMYLERAWDADPYKGRLLEKQRRYYSKRYRKQMLLNNIGIHLAHFVVANSEGIRTDIHKVNSRMPVYVVPNSISLQQSVPTAKPKKEQEQSLDFLFVGVMQPIKGIGTLLEAFKEYARTRAQDRLILIGRCLPIDREWFDGLLAHYRAFGSIEHMQHMTSSNLAEWYRDCDVFLFPSFYEGSPRVLLEAMTRGAPVIASDIPGNRLVDPKGRAIQFYEPGNVKNMVNLMKLVVVDASLRVTLCNASKDVASAFSHIHVASRLAAAYRDVIEVRYFR